MTERRDLMKMNVKQGVAAIEKTIADGLIGIEFIENSDMSEAANTKWPFGMFAGCAPKNMQKVHGGNMIAMGLDRASLVMLRDQANELLGETDEKNRSALPSPPSSARLTSDKIDALVRRRADKEDINPITDRVLATLVAQRDELAALAAANATTAQVERIAQGIYLVMHPDKTQRLWKSDLPWDTSPHELCEWERDEYRAMARAALGVDLGVGPVGG